jgi:hypothetical protein
LLDLATMDKTASPPLQTNQPEENIELQDICFDSDTKSTINLVDLASLIDIKDFDKTETSTEYVETDTLLSGMEVDIDELPQLVIDEPSGSQQIGKPEKAKRKKSTTKKVTFNSEDIQQMLDSSDTDIELETAAKKHCSGEKKGPGENRVTAPIAAQGSSTPQDMPPPDIPAVNQTHATITIPPIGNERGRQINVPIVIPTPEILNALLLRSVTDMGQIVNNQQSGSNQAPLTAAPTFIRIPTTRAITPVTEAPRLVARIMTVMAILLRPRETFTVVEISGCNGNEWVAPLQHLVAKMMKKEKLTVPEFEKYRQFSGFFFHSLICELAAHERSFASYYPVRIPEYAIDQQGQELLPYQCQPCGVGHLRNETCGDQWSNGPRTLEALHSSKSWRRSAKGIIIGCSQLVYPPPALKREYVTIFIYPNLTYQVDRPDVFSDPNHSSLYLKLYKIIKTIGSDVTIPLFIEFSESGLGTNARLTVYHHLCGFLKICKVLQSHYQGAIIPVYGLVPPVLGENRESYSLRKAASRRHKLGALALGLALGVPIGILDIQDYGPHQGNLSTKMLHWQDESLYGRYGQITREYQRRLAAWFQARGQLLASYPPHETGQARGGLTLHDG